MIGNSLFLAFCALLWVYMTRINIILKKHSVFMSKIYIFKSIEAEDIDSTIEQLHKYKEK